MTVDGRTRVGLDLGGTGARAVAVVDGVVVATSDVATAHLGRGPVPERVDRLAELVRSVVADDADLVGVGIGASGPVDVRAGLIRNPDTLPWFSGFPVVQELQSRLGVRVEIDNDAVTAALGERSSGAGRGCDRLLMVTLGTGVGAAFLVDGEPFRGRDGAHPEGGHVPVGAGDDRCYCGVTGCWEPSASRSRLQADLAAVLGTEVHRELLARAAQAAERPDVREVFLEYGRAVGRGLVALHSLYQPQVTVLGGSASAYLPLFEAGIRQSLRRAPAFDVPVELRAAQLGDTAGAIGAATGLL